MAEDRRTSDPSVDPSVDKGKTLDVQVEDLTRRIADVVNSADAGARQDLRDYALELLREETERSDAAPVPSTSTPVRSSSQSVGIALLLGLVSLPLLLLFPPVGFTLLACATVMGVWGIVAGWFGR